MSTGKQEMGGAKRRRCSSVYKNCVGQQLGGKITGGSGGGEIL